MFKLFHDARTKKQLEDAKVHATAQENAAEQAGPVGEQQRHVKKRTRIRFVAAILLTVVAGLFGCQAYQLQQLSLMEKAKAVAAAGSHQEGIYHWLFANLMLRSPDSTRHWFEQAQARGDARTAERLELLYRALARQE